MYLEAYFKIFWVLKFYKYVYCICMKEKKNIFKIKKHTHTYPGIIPHGMTTHHDILAR